MSNRIYDYSKYTERRTHPYSDLQKLVNQRKRADKWAEKYNKDLKHYNQLLIDNEQLKKTNEELNLMHHHSVIKILNLGQEIKKLNTFKQRINK